MFACAAGWDIVRIVKTQTHTPQKHTGSSKSLISNTIMPRCDNIADKCSAFHYLTRHTSATAQHCKVAARIRVRGTGGGDNAKHKPKQGILNTSSQGSNTLFQSVAIFDMKKIIIACEALRKPLLQRTERKTS